MSPIKGLSDQNRLPRLGKIHLGEKNDRGIPHATDYFVVNEEVAKVYGPNPTSLNVMIPVEDEEIWASQYYRRYSNLRGLVCRGDGEHCDCMMDNDTGDVATRESKDIVWMKGELCQGRECDSYISKACKEVMCLQFMLMDVPGLGIWQIDTSSINSIRNINSSAELIRLACGKISMIPLTLTLQKEERSPDGKKKIIRVLHLTCKQTPNELMAQYQAVPQITTPEVPLIEAPVEDEAPMDEGGIEEPMDNEPPEDSVEDILDEAKGYSITAEDIQQDIDELFPESGTQPDPPKAPPKKPKRNVDDIATHTQMVKACFEDFKLQPKDVLKELNVAKLSELKISPAEAYRQIEAVRK